MRSPSSIRLKSTIAFVVGFLSISPYTRVARATTLAVSQREYVLAARARGVGTCWTTLHLPHEREAAELLGIPYEEVMQTAMIPVAHTIGQEFRPGPRKALDTIVHWDQW